MPDWRLSFQRRKDVVSNRGALPFHRLSSGGDALRLLVPLPAGEALWIAWMIKPQVIVSGADASGNAMRIRPVSRSRDGWGLFAADALERPDGLHNLDGNSFALASTRKLLGDNHLRFVLHGERGEALTSVGVVLATPALYARLSGQPAPSPSAPGDAYRGWRLP
jgi:hypothetical protein